MALIELVGGLLWLLIGGDLLVRGSVALAKRARVSPMLVGLTVVALGTSAPELVVSIRAVLTGHAELALGNAVGSNIANVLVVVGVPAIIAPIVCDQMRIRRDTLIMLGTSVLFVLLCVTGPLGRSNGGVLLAGLALFFVNGMREARAGQLRVPEPGELERVLGLPVKRRTIAFFIVAGIFTLPLGADLLITGAIQISARLGVSEAVIGLSVIALGTSLPELATTLVAAFQRHADVAIGNVLGSNIMNLLAIMGAAALLSPTPIPVPAAFLRLDLPVMLAAAVLLATFTLRRASIGRTPGILLIVAYAVYLFVLFEPR